MTAWILIIISLTGSGVATATFDDKAACDSTIAELTTKKAITTDFAAYLPRLVALDTEKLPAPVVAICKPASTQTISENSSDPSGHLERANHLEECGRLFDGKEAGELFRRFDSWGKTAQPR